jgi:hypothetical protein
MAIKAYHGSPHKFDKFDLSKIGTGEGAQAYGHGLYMAESPGVAKGYAERLAIDPRDEINRFVKELRGIDGYVVTPRNEINAKLGEHPFLGPLVRDRPELADDIRKIAYSMKPDGTVSDEAMRVFIRLEKNLPEPSKQMYETNLRWPDPAREAADPLGPQHFLDWDKPMGKQAATIRKAWQATKQDLPPNAMDDLGGDLSLLYGPNVTPKDFLNTMMSLGGADNFGEIALKKQGVPGNRYLDAGSRGAGEGTANYVVFDDALLEILKRNGLPLK